MLLTLDPTFFLSYLSGWISGEMSGCSADLDYSHHRLSPELSEQEPSAVEGSAINCSKTENG